MAKTATEPLPSTITTAELAELLDISPERIRQLTQAGFMTRMAHGTYAFPDAMQGYFRSLRASAFGPAVEMAEEGYLAEIARLKARVAELEAMLATRK